MKQKKQINSTHGVNLVRKLVQEGICIFSVKQAREFAPSVGLSEGYIRQALHHLTKSGWLVRLKKGLYTISGSVPGVSAVHEYEIAMALTNPAAISHWSAFSYHGLTDQIPGTVFVLTTTESVIPRTKKKKDKVKNRGYPIGDTVFKFIQVKAERFFGTKKVWIGDARIMITDLERTLLDGLTLPRYCGDLTEVIHGFELKTPEINIDRIVEYALKSDVSVAKRLGWILEKQKVKPELFQVLAELPVKGYRQLDPSGLRKGVCNRRWMIQENLCL